MVHTALPSPHGHREQPVSGGDQDQRPSVDQCEVPHGEEDGHIPGIIRDTGDKLSVATHQSRCQHGKCKYLSTARIISKLHAAKKTRNKFPFISLQTAWSCLVRVQ